MTQPQNTAGGGSWLPHQTQAPQDVGLTLHPPAPITGPASQQAPIVHLVN